MCTSMSRRSGLDATSLDHLEVVAKLLGLSGIVPVEELLHAAGDARYDGVTMIAQLVEEMQSPDEHVLHPHCHLPLDGIGDLGPNLRTAGDERLAQRTVAIHIVEDRSRLTSIVRDEMAGCGLLSAARSGRLHEHFQLRRFTSRQ